MRRHSRGAVDFGIVCEALDLFDQAVMHAHGLRDIQYLRSVFTQRRSDIRYLICVFLSLCIAAALGQELRWCACWARSVYRYVFFGGVWWGAKMVLPSKEGYVCMYTTQEASSKRVSELSETPQHCSALFTDDVAGTLMCG